MTIQTGDKIPSVTLKCLGDAGMEEFDTAQALAGKKVVLFAVPGAFTPTCAQKHLPGYIDAAGDMKAKGIDEIICVSVNDPFVMNHWADVAGAAGKVTMWPDGNGAFADALGLTMDGSGAGLGKRLKRFSMVINDGVVESLEVEENPGDMTVSAAGVCLAKLG